MTPQIMREPAHSDRRRLGCRMSVSRRGWPSGVRPRLVATKAAAASASKEKATCAGEQSSRLLAGTTSC